jgi:hypothetical protein
MHKNVRQLTTVKDPGVDGVGLYHIVKNVKYDSFGKKKKFPSMPEDGS